MLPFASSVDAHELMRCQSQLVHTMTCLVLSLLNSSKAAGLPQYTKSTQTEDESLSKHSASSQFLSLLTFTHVVLGLLNNMIHATQKQCTMSTQTAAEPNDSEPIDRRPCSGDNKTCISLFELLNLEQSTLSDFAPPAQPTSKSSTSQVTQPAQSHRDSVAEVGIKLCSLLKRNTFELVVNQFRGEFTHRLVSWPCVRC